MFTISLLTVLLGLRAIFCQGISPSIQSVTTPYGRITGIAVDVIGLVGTKTYQFRKIPYAKPPTGDLRFTKPQPYGKWNGTLDGTSFGPSCMQMISPTNYKFLPNLNVSEDCLFLNIYVPNEVDATKNKSVLVWIHGGGYDHGQGMMYDGSYMAAKADVIVVTINYRLNVFGFLTLGNEVMKGNYGIWDQIAALQWVQKAISSFGGDPDSVTIFGESSGGFSVGLLSLIPSNKGLFKRVIAENGVGNSFLATTRNGVIESKEIGKTLGCNSSRANDILKCLKSLHADDILKAKIEVTHILQPSIHLTIGLAPVVDNELFLDLPEELLCNTSTEASRFFHSLDIVVGNCNSEGSLLFNYLSIAVQKQFNFNFTIGLSYKIFCDNIVHVLTADYYSGNVDVKDAICRYYGVKDNKMEQAKHAVNMYTDLFFLSPSIATLRSHAKSNAQKKSFQYIFTKSTNPGSNPKPHWFTGAEHASEVYYLFGLRTLPLLNITINQEDLDLSDKLITYWTNFAKTGDPNGKNSDNVRTTWPEFELGSESYIDFGVRLVTGGNYTTNRMRFCLEDIPNLLNTTETTEVSTTKVDNSTSHRSANTTNPLVPCPTTYSTNDGSISFSTFSIILLVFVFDHSLLKFFL